MLISRIESISMRFLYHRLSDVSGWLKKNVSWLIQSGKLRSQAIQESKIWRELLSLASCNSANCQMRQHPRPWGSRAASGVGGPFRKKSTVQRSYVYSLLQCHFVFRVCVLWLFFLRPHIHWFFQSSTSFDRFLTAQPDSSYCFYTLFLHIVQEESLQIDI